MKRVATVGLVLGLLLLVAPSHAGGPEVEAAGQWLASRQEPSGEVPGYRGTGTGELLIALLAGGQAGDPTDRAVAFIDGHDDDLPPGRAGRLALGLHAAGEDAGRFAGAIRDGYDATTGAYEENVYAHALAMLGAVVAGVDVPDRAVTYLAANQCIDGGFAWQRACGRTPDTDTTSMVVQALVAVSSTAAVEDARRWLLDNQRPDGGWGFEPGDPTNANSTGLALSAISALAEDPMSPPWASADRSPHGALLSLQDGSGGFRHLPERELTDYATIQAVIGLAGVALPPPVFERTGEAGTPPPSRTPLSTTTPPPVPEAEPEGARATDSAAPLVSEAPTDGPISPQGSSGGSSPWLLIVSVVILATVGGIGWMLRR